MLAASEGYVETVNVLLEKGANMEARSKVISMNGNLVCHATGWDVWRIFLCSQASLVHSCEWMGFFV